MKRTKFRAWNGEEMLYPITDNIGTELESWIDAGYDIMQFTGLKDKNGKEIYEGDIVRVKHYDEGCVVGVVVWLDRWASFAIYIKKEELYKDINEGLDIEVIGNIYENPELLSKGENNGV